MKRIAFFIIVIALTSSCKCLIAQIGPQYLYVGENCEVLLPDYLPMVTVTDNCGVKSITQEPVAGTILNAESQQIFVTIRAIDVFDNVTEMTFSVKAIDTIPPVITPNEELLTDNWLKIHAIYDMADKLVAEQERFFDDTFPWDELEIPEHLRPIDEYYNKTMRILVAPTHAITGFGTRFIDFLSEDELKPCAEEEK